MIEVKFPGKLFILGEYSIMEPGHSAIITAVERYLIGEIKAHDTIYIESDYGILTEDHVDEQMIYVERALEVAQDYLQMKEIEIKPFHLILTSELNNEKNQKYGFGSSGVVIVTVLDAILKFHKIKLEEITLFKLAVVTQYRMKTRSSGGDLAASIYGGLIFYTRYRLKDVSADVTCILKPWQHLKIQRIKNPYAIEVAYTGQSHDTNQALSAFQKLKESNYSLYYTLIDKANQLVLEGKDDYLKSISKYRQWMLELGAVLQYEIETPALTKLIESANQLDYSAKISGSGGGDCGFAILENNKNRNTLIKTWVKFGLEPIEGAVK